MNKRMRPWIYWTPRLLCVAFALFISMFALDVFGHGRGPWQTILALLMHLLPTTGVVLAVLALSWRWEWVGAVLFTALGILYIVMFAGRFPWIAYVAISGPLFLMGGLFLAGWLWRDQVRSGA